MRGSTNLLVYTIFGGVLLFPFARSDGFYVGLLVGVFFGTRTLDRSLADDIRPVEVLSLSWSGAWRGLLKALAWWAVVIVGSVAVFVGELLLVPDQPMPISSTLVLLSLYAFPAVIIGGMAFGAVRGGRLKTRSHPNQGIRRSVRSAVVAAVMVGAALGLLGPVAIVAIYVIRGQ